MTVIELSAHYRLIDGLSTEVTLDCDLPVLDVDQSIDLNCDPDGCEPLFLTIIHERFVGEIIQYDFSDASVSVPLEVHQGESLTVLARHEGRIVGCLVSEVNTSEQSRLLLLPRGGYNVLIHQQRMKRQSGQLVPRETGQLAAIC